MLGFLVVSVHETYSVLFVKIFVVISYTSVWDVKFSLCVISEHTAVSVVPNDHKQGCA